MIFDEAHNLESVAEDGVSFELSIRDLENCEADLNLIRQHLGSPGELIKMTEEKL